MFGPVRAPAVVLCDGIGCSGYVWKYLATALAEDQRVIHFHYRGHGRTPAPKDPTKVSIEDLSSDLISVLDAAVGADQPAALIGHSMGVQVCLETYRQHRARVRSLTLMCGSYGRPLSSFHGVDTLEKILPLLRVGVGLWPGLIARLWRTIVPTGLSYEIATRIELNRDLIAREDFFPYLQDIATIDPQLFFAMLAKAGRHSAKDLLHDIKVPVLILAGEQDNFTPPELSHEMHRLIPGAELHVVAGGSHTAPLERPQEITERVHAFLRRM